MSVVLIKDYGLSSNFRSNQNLVVVNYRALLVTTEKLEKLYLVN